MLYFANGSCVPFLGTLLQSRLFALVLFTGIVFCLSCNKPANTVPSNSTYNSLLDSANHLFDAGKYDIAVKYLDSATSHYNDLDLPQKFEYYSFNCNYYFHIKKDNVLSMPYADSILALFNTPEKKLKYISRYGQAFFFKGDVLFQENKYTEAYRYFYQGKLIANKDVNDCTLGDYSYRMGMIMYKQEHYKLAAQNFKIGARESTSCELNFRSFYRRQELLNNTGLSYSKIDETDSALVYFKRALDFIDQNAGRFKNRKPWLDVARGVVYGNQANIYIGKNNIPMAVGLLKKSITINLKKGNDNKDAELSELKLAHIYYQTHQAQLLTDLLAAVQKQLSTVKNPDAEADWNYLMAKYFSDKNQSSAALNYFTRYDALKDSLSAQVKALKEADIEQQIKQLENDYALSNLKKDNETQNLYLKIAVVFGIMLIIIISLILLNWRKSARNIKTLGSLNRKINDQNHHLAKALRDLKVNSQEKDRILRAVAHDLRNPIGGIASLSELMMDEDYTHEQKEMIEIIRETSVNSLELINDILEMANHGTKHLTKEIVELNSLLNNSVELLRFKAAEKGQLIKLELLNAPVELTISREKIWRVVSNLISNAIKFSLENTTIHVKIEDLDDEVKISVRDEGIGIPDQLKDKVFNTFTDAKRNGTAGEKSFGLGLSICKQIIDDHNGKIWFESSGQGTTFYISLPKIQVIVTEEALN